MRALAADENFNRKVLNGVLNSAPQLDIIRIQESDIGEADDPELLAWTAERNLILLSHDKATVPHFANERIKAGLPMPGVLIVPQTASTKLMIEEIILAVCGFSDEEWDNRVQYLPLT